MANKAGYVLAGVLTAMWCVSVWAQQKGSVKAGNNKPVKDTTLLGKKKASRPTVYLGHTNFSGGIITPIEFNAAAKEGISSRDETGNQLKIIGFTFNYAEKRLFEDSAGDMSMQTDFSTEYCFGDTLCSNVSATIYDRVKSGDTVYFSQVMVERKIGSDIDTIMGKELRCIIRRNKQ